jgi:hypothetical protein
MTTVSTKFSFDGDPEIKMKACPKCGNEHQSVTGFVLSFGGKHSVYWADWYPHEQEAWLDVTLGTFKAPAYDDNVTFSCRIGHVKGQAAPACSLVQAPTNRSPHPILGQTLSREQALGHGRLTEFWAVTDWLILNDPVLHEHVYHMPAKS